MSPLPYLGDLFPESHSSETATALGIPYLGGIPFDPRLAAAADHGTPFVLAHSETLAGQAILTLAEALQQFTAAHQAGESS